MSDIKAPAQSYDLTLTVGRVGHLIATAAGHGLTLSDDAIAWTSAGKLESRALADITGVHLESAAVINQGMTDLCQIEFADGTKLTVTNLQWGVFAPADSRHTDLLRAFADDLHRRLPDAVKPTLPMALAPRRRRALPLAPAFRRPVISCWSAPWSWSA